MKIQKRIVVISFTLFLFVVGLEFSSLGFSQEYLKTSEYVPLPDGTQLAADIYLPSEGGGPFPVLLNYLPYKRAIVDYQTGEIKVLYAPDHQKMLNYFTENGYAVVIADMRGSGASFGSKDIDFSPVMGADGKELIDWIEVQSWCNGNVGMYGGSYHGWSQFAVAGQKPQALKCIMPEVMAFDMFSGGFFYYNGIYDKVAMDMIWPTITLLDLDAYIPGHQRVAPVAPVIDEDNDGDLIDEIPLYKSGTPPLFFINNPPQYSDGEPRTENIYYNAILDHVNNRSGFEWVPNAAFRDSNLAGLGYTYADIGPSDWPLRMSESKIGIYNVGAWFDIFTLGTTQWYATMRASNPSKMFIHPSFHSVLSMSACAGMGPYWQYFGEDCQQASDSFLEERVRFFDHYLKGTKNEIHNEPSVRIYVMNGEGWRSEDQWPLARQVSKKYYLDAQNALLRSRIDAGSDNYTVDFTHSSRYGTNNMGRYLPGGAPNAVMKRTSKDLQCLTYTSKPVEEDTEVTGHPIVHLYVSSTADDGDFFVYLEDVDENGESYYVTEGTLRAGFAHIVPQENILPHGAKIDVKPDLPYHGYRESDYVGNILAGGKKIELVIDLLPTSWVFKKGHQIRVSIAGADWPNFQLHPKLSATNNPSDPNNTVPTITVYRDAQHLSRIELPIIPRKPILFEGVAKIRRSDQTYSGPAELYTYQGAVYLHYEDRWVKWETVRSWQEGSVEHYKGRGEMGNIAVLVKNKGKSSFDCLASGQNVHFKGIADGK
jgi:uncharacterized protein